MHNVSIVCGNVRSIKNKMEELKFLLGASKNTIFVFFLLASGVVLWEEGWYLDGMDG